jgi:[FeFe] hydrogenase H-cluster maturation GTPase HydF
MQATPRSNRLHIALLGRRNAGKSSLLNAITNQNLAVVSSVPGTTTDPVYKSMELLPFGPVVLIDTPGMDDEGELGAKRVAMAKKALRQADMAIIVYDVSLGVSDWERQLAQAVQAQGLPGLLVGNKVDLTAKTPAVTGLDLPELGVSALTKQGIDQLKAKLVELAPQSFWEERPIIGDLLQPGDQVLLIVPIDKAAPKGRLILPQVQVIRDLLDHGMTAVVARESEAREALARLNQPPQLVVTDSQVFAQADAITPPNVQLTSFSVLFARQKGDLATLLAGAKAINSLRPGDRVLIAEACTHRRQHEDIGTIKIPNWLNQRVGGQLNYQWSSGTGFPEDLREFKLVVHCGACMLNRRAMLARLEDAAAAGVPIVNYGVLIAYLQGILPRALQPFGLSL